MSSIAPITLEGVYYVESPDRRIGHIAIRPKFQEKRAEWDDTSTGMTTRLADSSMHWQQLKQDSTPLLMKIDLVLYNYKHLTLQYLTLEFYNEKLKSKSVGNLTFSSTEEVQQYYLNTDFFRLE